MTPLNLAMLDYFIIYLPVIYIAIPKAKNVQIQLSTSLLLMYVEDLDPSLNALIYLSIPTYFYLLILYKEFKIFRWNVNINSYILFCLLIWLTKEVIGDNKSQITPKQICIFLSMIASLTSHPLETKGNILLTLYIERVEIEFDSTCSINGHNKLKLFVLG